MSDDESFSYAPEVEQIYTDAETQEAMQFMRENDLPMSDLLYALKYVRILNRATDLDEQFKQIKQRLHKLRTEDIPVVKPPTAAELQSERY
ncbi:CG14113 [Drosophila busckii]|uniref:CG14113 n=1 Tax=Drosophila busckii TaxID=30019 RepID=A0A0M5JBJ6_DROBS|nr:uncharacterized protein LOC108600397 [Drosophila busckii]ALC44556.1 CG14113 [Drosophila busckii]